MSKILTWLVVLTVFVGEVFTGGFSFPEDGLLNTLDNVKNGVVKTVKKTYSSSSSDLSYGAFSSSKSDPCRTHPDWPIKNAGLNCINNRCQIKCIKQYEFPNKETQLSLTCLNGEWDFERTEWTEVPPCKPICLPTCQNQGICISPGRCACPDNYIGSVCEKKKEFCVSQPRLPKNSEIRIQATTCTITCRRGYTFPDKTAVANMECRNGQWIPSRPDLTSIPDCEPTCNPPCQSGGKCLSLNVCQCPPERRGGLCQFDKNVCNPKERLGFNGIYNCSGDANEMKCDVSCPLGIKLSAPATNPYVCKYENGQYLPANVPQCIFPPGVQIVPLQESSHSFYSNSSSSSSSSGSSSQSTKRRRKKIIVQSGDEDEYDNQSYEKIITKTKIEIKHRKKPRTRTNQAAEYYEYEDDVEQAYSEAEEQSGMYSMYLSGGVSVLTRTPQSATCSAWNGNKVKTFDGLIYTAPLRCSHTLVQDVKDGTFSVVLRSCPAGGISCNSTAIEVIMDVKRFTFEVTGGELSIWSQNRKLQMPLQRPEIRASLLGHRLQVQLDSLGVTIYWNLEQMVTVETTAALWQRTGGLCGTLDADDTNDFRTKDGTLVKTANSFVDSWATPLLDVDPKQCVSNDDTTHANLTCSPARLIDGERICLQLIESDKFTNCLKIVNKRAFVRSCVSDYCACNVIGNPEKCACNSAAVLASDCQFRGVVFPQGWRNLNVCPVTCPRGETFRACGPVFEPFCGSTVDEVNAVCNEGCFCPDGMLRSAGVCVYPESCPCSLRGKVFQPKQTIRKDCNTCQCVRGVWSCSDHTCGARCGAVGDPHYRTFDNKRFDFQGKCSYVLMKTANVTVEAENIACSGQISADQQFASVDQPSCTKSVTIRLTNGARVEKVQLGQGRVVTINDQTLKRVPIKLFDGKLHIREASSFMLLVSLQDGLQVWWDGLTNAYIDAPATYRNRTSGLCGTFNANSQDDFLTPDGDVESAVSAFANKWQTKETCPYVDNGLDIPHPCQLNLENKDRALRVCEVLRSTLFAECHFYVEPAEFYDDCVYDMCACTGLDITNCLCPVLSAYASQCAQQGIALNWRHSVNECAIKCPVGQVFEECGDSCYRSCADRQFNEPCHKTCVEGCRCPAGQSLNDNGECVSTDLCPCLYDGQHFKAGYKEVRSGSKYLELCTCKGATWHCTQAQDGDEIRHPRSADIRLQCLNDTNSEFVTCRPTVPLSCKNMHNFQDVPTIDCQAGCACKKGYVLDAFTHKCILPESCGCHHGGKSYQNGALIKDECNDCTCHDGSWTCTKLQCPATCTAWGDSHFESFDGKDFDFQGVCSYVLSKGSLQATGQSYAITIQNVLCGSLGVTCSKSVSISVLGDHKETITLVAAGHERNAAAVQGNSQMLVYDAGVFTVVELIGMDVQVKWDRGTRVYIRVGNAWRGLVKGLCGNFNGDAEDDLKTPAKGVESSSTIFGNSWKLEDYCEKPKDQIDTCAAHPERKVWSQRQCGILKSDVFKACHSEVNVDRYMRLCVYDTCACDQGGDCECLCTAVAAYAHACSMKGVAIRWRTPTMCPMQCDSHCSEYTPCLKSACPVETCDDTNGIATSQQLQTANRACATDTCVEGCQLKPCPDGQIYRNSTYTECVPRSTCRPLCKTIGDINYYEGDILTSDACHTCRCSRGQSVCSGVPCTVQETTTTTTTRPPTAVKSSTTTTTTAQPWMDSGYKCQPGWSSWINQDALGGTKSTRKNGDREPLPNEILLNNLPAKSASCRIDQMTEIECRTVGSHRDHKQLGENVECSLERGLLAIGLCSDYEIRVLCSCGPVTTKPPVVREEVRDRPPRQQCDPTQPLTEHPTDCHRYLECELSGNTWAYAEKLCPATTMFNPVTTICDWPLAVQEVKPQCTFRRQPQPIDHEVEYIKVTTTKPNVHEEVPSDCNPGAPNIEFAGDCARFWQCDQNAGGSWKYVAKTCGPGTLYNPSNMICDWPAAVQKVRPNCGAQAIVVVPTTTPVAPITPVVRHHQPGGPCDANTPNVEYPGDCQRFLQCLMSVSGGWTFVEKSCGPGTMFNPVAMICDWPLAVQEVKPECGARRPHTTAKPPVVSENQSRCPSGQLWTSATVQCNATCHYYYNARLRPQKQCRNQYDTFQLDRCVPLTEAQSSCGWGRVWREDNVCTDKAHCTCVTRSGEMLKPGAIYKESACEVCQCTNNDYVCDKSRCSTESTGPVVVPTKPTIREELLIVVDSTKSPPAKCDRSRMLPIINGFQPLPDSIFTASSTKHINHVPKYARLSPKSSFDSHFWMPQTSDVAQYLKIALPKPTPIYGIVVRGSDNEYDLFVTSFKVVYSFDDTVYHPVVQSGSAQIFRGPIDSSSPVETLFGTPIEAKYLRIYPLTWHTDIALQAELLGCADSSTTTTTTIRPPVESSTRLPTTHVNVIVDKPLCDDPMGVDDGRLHPEQIKFSSVKLPAGSVRLSTLPSWAGWRPLLNTQLEYVVVDFLEPRLLTGLSTRGGPSGWVTSYLLKYSMDGREWNAYEDNARRVKSFLANYDGTSAKTNYFEKPINARFIRVVPTNWHTTIELKLEPIGCFKPYPKTNFTEIVLEEPDSVCGLCPGVLPSANAIPGSCYCNPPFQWNGQSCVDSSLCPCMVGHVAYDVGAKYKLNDCSECSCLIGGHAQCTPFACPPCNSGLRSVQSGQCTCRCEPCRAGDVLCPSSGVCIPETSWCDGIVDCPDDELFCSDVRNANTTVKVIEKTVITKTCPKAACPPGYTIKYVTNGTASQSDENLTSIKYTTKTKTTRKYSDPNPNTPAKWQLPTPKKSAELPAGLVADCVKFKCIPLQAEAYEVHGPTAGGACPLPKCPEGYNVVMEPSSGTACGNFTCKLDETRTERVCNVTGRSFETFDGTAFKYDICNHILARDLVANQWSIAIAKNCDLGNSTCTKSLLIRDADDTTTITLLQSLQVQIDHYTFTMLQLQQSNHPKLRAYVISRVGNTLVMRSHHHGFWLTFNQFGEVRIGLTDRHRNTVDGLCGYFNGIAADDRRTPTGTVLLNTEDFGDSWSLNGTEDAQSCEPQQCPRHLQAKALEMCNNIRTPSFAACAPLVAAAPFIERCIEFACECLRPSAVLDVRSADQPAISSDQQCKCDVLQQYAVACLAAADATAFVHLDRWRAVHDCAPTKCPVGMIYQECSRRPCEPTCAPRTATSPVSDRCDETVVVSDGACYPGCYCPAGQLRQGDVCIEAAECTDCVCHGEGIDNTEISTYDGTVQPLRADDCTVLLSRGGGGNGIIKSASPSFEVYVRFGPCATVGNALLGNRCVNAFYVFAGADAAHIRLDPASDRLTVNNVPLLNGAHDLGWLHASRSANQWLVRLPKAKIELIFDSHKYALRVPSVRYGTTLEGSCGNCNGNPADDGVTTKLTGVAALQNSPLLAKQPDAWRRELTAAAAAKCTIDDHNEVELLPCSKPLSPDPCAALLDYAVFGLCHFIVDPQPFVAECQQDVCRNADVTRTCQHIGRYAAACRDHAICVDTANLTTIATVRCLKTPTEVCPVGTRFESCGCPLTCAHVVGGTAPPRSACPIRPIAGCVCPAGYVFANSDATGGCVPERACRTCDDQGKHRVGDRWQTDACTECVCGDDGRTNCVRQQCPAPEVCQRGYVRRDLPVSGGACCGRSVCEPTKPDGAPVCPIDATVPVSCGENQEVRAIRDAAGCVKHICDCVPAERCPPLETVHLYEGQTVMTDATGCCPVHRIRCDAGKCASAGPPKCETRFHESYEISDNSTVCCPKKGCRPPKDKCIVRDPVGVVSTRGVLETWPTADPCRSQRCAYNSAGVPTIVEDVLECPKFKCAGGWTLQKDAQKCCPTCQQAACVLDGNVVVAVGESVRSADNCTVHKCSKQTGAFLITSVAERCPDIGACPANLRYVSGCCELCKAAPLVQDQVACLATTLSPADTVKLVEKKTVKYGMCRNPKPIDGFTECNGACRSGTSYNKANFKQLKQCDCCQVDQLQTITVPLLCDTGDTLDVAISIPKTCKCLPCEGDVIQPRSASLINEVKPV